MMFLKFFVILLVNYFVLLFGMIIFWVRSVVIMYIFLSCCYVVVMYILISEKLVLVRESI